MTWSRHIQNDFIEGVPVFSAPEQPGFPSFAAVLFRVGRSDETLSTSGITHLVEHLVLPVGPTPPVEFNGAVDGTTTTVWFSGPGNQPLSQLSATVGALAELPMRRLERERAILRTEADSRGYGGLGHALALRFGAEGHGLSGYDELGLGAVDAERVQRWALERFTRANVALYLVGPQDQGLEFALPAVAPPPAVEPRPIDYLELPATFVGIPPGGVWLSFVAERTTAASAALSALDTRLRSRLRARTGMSYEVTIGREPLSGSLTHVFVHADCLESNVEAVKNTMLATLDEIADRGPSSDEIARYAEDIARSGDDAHYLFGLLSWHAEWALWGNDFESHETRVANARAVTPGDAAGSLAAALPSLLLALPEGARPPGGRFRPYPYDSPRGLEGRRFPRRRSLWRRKEDSSERELVLADEGVTLIGDGYVRTVTFPDCVALVRWQAGGRTLWGRDGFAIWIDPSLWRGGSRLTPAIDAAVPSDLVVDFSAPVVLFADPDLQAGSDAYDEGDMDRAVELLERGLQRDPYDERAWNLVAAAHLNQERWGLALIAAERAYALDPNHELVARIRASALWHSGKQHEAAEAVRHALDLAPGELETLSQFAWFMAGGGFEAEAARAAERALELYPDESDAWFAKGFVAQTFGRFDEAEPAFRRAIELNSDDAMWHNNLGWLLLQTGRTDAALRAFDDALKRDPRNSYATFNRAHALRRLNRMDEAARVYRDRVTSDLATAETAFRENPRDVWAARRRVTAFWQLGREHDALTAAREAGEAMPDDAGMLRRLVLTELDCGNVDEAANVLDRVLALDPENLETLNLIARVGAFGGDAAAAVSAGERAVEDRPSARDAITAAGYAALAAGKPDEARGWFEKALAMTPLDCCAHAGRGIALARMGDLDGARLELREAELTSAGRCSDVPRLSELLGG